MSWISENYEKAALGGAAVIAVGLVAVIWNNHSEAADAYTYTLPSQQKDASVAGLAHIVDTQASFGSVHEIVKPSDNGRPVDLFTSVPIFVKKGAMLDPVDLLKGASVHEGIDNTFWIKYNLDPGYDNAPELDPDGDGFTNGEEYTANTDPTKYDSHPDPVLKLAVVKVNTSQYHLKPAFYSGRSTFRLETKKGDGLNRMREPIAAGNVIAFDKESMQNRFKFISVEGDTNRNRVWTIEDLKPNKKGVIYKFTKKGNLVGDAEREFGIMDSIVDFRLDALDESSNVFSVEENTKFSLPNKEGAKKNYLFRKIDLTEKTIEIDYKNAGGEVVTHVVQF